jgi:hypothetical protein
MNRMYVDLVRTKFKGVALANYKLASLVDRVDFGAQSKAADAKIAAKPPANN